LILVIISDSKLYMALLVLSAYSCHQ